MNARTVALGATELRTKCFRHVMLQISESQVPKVRWERGKVLPVLMELRGNYKPEMRIGVKPVQPCQRVG